MSVKTHLVDVHPSYSLSDGVSFGSHCSKNYTYFNIVAKIWVFVSLHSLDNTIHTALIAVNIQQYLRGGNTPTERNVAYLRKL